MTVDGVKELREQETLLLKQQAFTACPFTWHFTAILIRSV